MQLSLTMYVISPLRTGLRTAWCRHLQPRGQPSGHGRSARLLVPIVRSLEAVDRPPLPLGGTASPFLTFGNRSRLGSFLRRQVVEKCAGGFGRAAPLGKALHLEHADMTIESNRDHVTGPHWPA